MPIRRISGPPNSETWPNAAAMMVRHGIIRRENGRYELCSAMAEIPSKRVTLIPAWLASAQAKTISEYENLQDALRSHYNYAEKPVL